MIGPFHFICLACQQEASKQAKKLTKYYMGEFYTKEYKDSLKCSEYSMSTQEKNIFCDAQLGLKLLYL